MSVMDEIQELVDSVRDNRIAGLNTVAAAALLGYDILLTLTDEIDLVWRSTWSFINVLHLLIRYYSLAYLLSSSYGSVYYTIRYNLTRSQSQLILAYQLNCRVSFVYQIWGAVVVVPAADILVIMRVYALYNQNKKIGIFLIFLWIVELSCLLGFVSSAFTSDEVKGNPLPGILPGCFPTDVFRDKFVIQGGSIAIAIQGVYLGLTLNVLFRRVQRALTPMLQIFFRDGALYCFVLLIMYLVNILFLVFAENSALQSIGQEWLISFVAISAGRLVLNLRGTIRSPHRSGSDFESSRQGYTSEEIELGHFTSVIVIDGLGSECHSPNPRRLSDSLLTSTFNSSRF